MTNNEPQMWKEAVVAYFRGTVAAFVERPENSHKNVRSGYRFPGQDLNTEPSEYKAECLRLTPHVGSACYRKYLQLKVWGSHCVADENSIVHGYQSPRLNISQDRNIPVRTNMFKSCIMTYLYCRRFIKSHQYQQHKYAIW